MSESTLRSQTVPSLVSAPQSTPSDDATVSILSGLSGTDDRKRRRRPLWPAFLALVAAMAAGLVWWQGLPEVSGDTALRAEVAETVAPVSPESSRSHDGDTASMSIVETTASDPGIAAAPLPEPPAVAVIEEVPVQSGVAPDAAGADTTGASAAVEIGLVSPEAAEPKSVAVAAPRVAARKTASTPRKPPRRAIPASADADVEIITAIVKGAASR